MSTKTRVILWITGIILLFGLIFLIWAIDTGRLGIKAEPETTIESAEELNTLPSPDQSTFQKIFTAIIKPFVK